MNLDLVRYLFEKGGPSMYALLALSILSIATILERLWFWINIAMKERAIVNRVLEAARYDWGVANEIARQANRQPIGRFLYSPLRLQNPDPEVFRLALEAAADDEIANMRRGDKVLEAVIALSPLLGLLGTVLGLIHSLSSIRLGDLGTQSTAGVTLGIGEALISTATGLVVAITSLAFYRMFQAFIFQQAKVFRKAGSELELLYRQFWPHSHQKQSSYYQESEPPRYREPAPESPSRNRRQFPQTPPELKPDTFEAPPAAKPRLKQATPPEEPNSQEIAGVAEVPAANTDTEETVTPTANEPEITTAAEPAAKTQPPKKGIKDRLFGWGKTPVQPSPPATTETENPFTPDVSEPDTTAAAAVSETPTFIQPAETIIVPVENPSTSVEPETTAAAAVSETPTFIQPAETIIVPVETPSTSVEDSQQSDIGNASNSAETSTKIEDSN